MLLCSFVFVFYCGVVISTRFPLSYKTSVFIQYHAPLFQEKGVQVDPSFVDCYYHSYKLQPTRSLQSYGVCENDMIVLHDRRFSEGSWASVVEGLRKRVAELEKKVAEDEEAIALLSCQLQQFRVSFIASRCILYCVTKKGWEETGVEKRTKPSCLSNPTTF